MKKLVSIASASLLFASGALAHGVHNLRLVVGTLDGQSLRSCERRYGLSTQVSRQSSTVVKIWGFSRSRTYSVQVECDTSMQIKAVAFSHPVNHDSQEVIDIIDSLLGY